MSTKYLPSSSGTYSYNSGKYRFKLVESHTATGFTFTLSLTITEATKSGHYIQFQYKDGDGNWQTVKSKKTHKAKGTSSFTAYMTTAETLEVKAQFGGNGWKSFPVIDRVASVSTPTITAEPKNDALISLTINGTATATKYVTKVNIERKEDNGNWSSLTDIAESHASDYTILYDDTTVTAGHYYQYRATAYKDDSASYVSAETSAIYTTPVSSEISGSVNAERVDNTKVNISWQLSSVTPVQLGLVKQFILKRSVNGGAYDDLKTIDATTSTTNYSVQDSDCKKDNVYRYGIDIVNSEGKKMYAPLLCDDAIRMTPTEPQAVSLTLTSANIPVLTITNSSFSATDVEIQRKENDGSWETEATEEYPCTEYEGDEVEEDVVVKYRIRNVADDSSITPTSDKYSSWCESGTGGGAGGGGVSPGGETPGGQEIPSTKTKPNAPTLLSPIGGSKQMLEGGTVVLSWQHNATDGSSQESARIMYKINSGSYTTATVTTSQRYSLNVASLSANDKITWKVSTKGAYESYSDYSSERTFTMLSRPTLAFTSPNNASVISSLPIVLGWTYSDLSGTLESLKATIKKGEETIQVVDVPVGAGTSGSYSYTLADFLPDNNTAYSITAVALSSSGLSASQTIGITVQYNGITITGGLLPSVTFDEDTGYATIQIMRDITPEGGVVPTPLNIVAAYLYRVYEGETILVKKGLGEGSTIVDKYAPINVDYTYKLLQITNLGGIGETEVVVNNPTPYWYVLWGDNTARAIWNPTGSATLGRPERTEVRYSGRKFAVSYDSDAQEETYAFSTVLMERDELVKFKTMMREGGQGIWKSGDGECYKANFTFDYSNDFKSQSPMWNCSLEVTRIDGGE